MLQRAHLTDIADLCRTVWTSVQTGRVPPQLRERLCNVIFESLDLLFEFNPLGSRVQVAAGGGATTLMEALRLPAAMPSFVSMVWVTASVAKRCPPTPPPIGEYKDEGARLRAEIHTLRNMMFALTVRGGGERGALLITPHARALCVTTRELATVAGLRRINPTGLARGREGGGDPSILRPYRTLLHLAGASFLYLSMERRICDLHTMLPQSL